MLRKILFFAVLLSFVFLAACGNNEEASGSDSGSSDGGEASSNYPEDTVTIYVNYSAGGNTDLNYRKLAEIAEKYLGQDIVIENKTGGGGTTGLAELANAKPDGYTLGNVSMAPLTVNPHLQPVTYTPESFEFIGGWGKQIYGLAVKGDAPYDDFEGFLEYAKENPGMTFSDPGAGALNWLAVYLLDEAENHELQFEGVPYEGGGESTSAVLGGHVDFTSNNPAPLIPGLESGDLKLIASLSDIRIDAAPDVPTIRELGYDYDVTSWFGLGAPAGTPQEVLDKWDEVMQQVLEDPEFQEAAEQLMTPLEWLPGQDYADLVKENYDRYGEIYESVEN